MSAARRVFAKPWVGPLFATLAVYAVFAALMPDRFFSAITLETMATQTVVVALGAVGMTIVIVSGGIDLSVGSMVAFVAVVVALVLREGHGPALAVLAGLGAGATCGALNGALVAALRIGPFIVTLGTMSILRGAAKGLASEQPVAGDARGLDETMALLPPGSARLFPTGVWVAVAAAALGAVLLGRARWGRHVVAVGSSEAAARLAGIRIGRVTLGAYAVAGLLAGVAGVLDFAKLTMGDPTGNAGLELSVIAAVVIGGGSLTGGKGSVTGSMMGALLMTVIATGATYMGIANWVQEILTGVIIVAAVALDRLRGG